ncbi:MAG: hypothetical protein ACFFD4_12020 [Candidatus Odinarchaeota archaeon]
MSSIISFLEEILFKKSSKSTNTVIQSANELFNQAKYSNAEKELQKLTDKRLNKEDELKYLFLKSQICMKTGRFEEMSSLTDDLLRLAKHNRDRILTIDILITAAEANFRLARLDSSMDYLNEANERFSLIQEQELPVDERKEKERSLTNLKGAIFSKQGRLTEALESYKTGLELAEEVNNKRGMAIAHNNIGTVLT